MRLLPTALTALGCALALPAAANAATTLGQHPDGVLEGTSTSCPGGCTIVQDRNANEQMRVPASLGAQGVVVAWRVRGDGEARLQRVVVDGAGNGTAPAATDRVQLTGALQEIPARLPVAAGDAIGLELSDGASVDSVALGFGDSTLTWQPALAGTPRAAVETEGAVIAFQAVIEPDADADGLGDETQDTCVNCGGGTPGGDVPPPDNGGTQQPPPDADPYAAIRKAGPSATIAGAATRVGRKVAVTVTNPYAFELKGKLQLKRGRKVVAKASLKLAANATRTVSLKVRKPAGKLTAVATLRAPVGAARTTTRKVKVSKPKPGKGGVDGTYRGSGAGADWVMVIKDGVVTNFNGSITIYCTKAGEQQNHSFAMIGDDPDPRVAADGSFAWEATSGYGFDKLKFDGVVKGGRISGKMMAESRPLIQGVSPVSGLPRLEPEYCFAGREYTLTKD
jgi:hypothetical protein